MHIVPHNTQTDEAGTNILQFASAIPNSGPYMEFPCRGPHKPVSWCSPQSVIRNGVVPVPAGPGLGVELDPEFLRQTRKVETC